MASSGRLLLLVAAIAGCWRWLGVPAFVPAPGVAAAPPVQQFSPALAASAA
eukprot:CAMPEP_0171098012 /NCGR_PEP_ID=MMETSP0766_2-20121228/47884_1 /TAXON_ID=439317 /ORGANISM="Gambierdiscus australes, Strain CAWD 149" /LENGTH=50 /DNA_ID=CAMNT_0011557299 /DNA_START=49 /DNA_END=197 /DNA_ORIENTATION=+